MDKSCFPIVIHLWAPDGKHRGTFIANNPEDIPNGSNYTIIATHVARLQRTVDDHVESRGMTECANGHF